MMDAMQDGKSRADKKKRQYDFDAAFETRFRIGMGISLVSLTLAPIAVGISAFLGHRFPPAAALLCFPGVLFGLLIVLWNFFHDICFNPRNNE